MKAFCEMRCVWMNRAYINNSDTEIWRDFREGDKQAYAYIYQSYYNQLYNYGSKISKDSDLVKDAIHDLFVELWKNKQRLGETDSIKYYLYKSIRRKIVNELIQNNKYENNEEYLAEYNFEIILSPESDLICHQITKEQQDKLLKAVNSLTKRQKEAIFLRYFEDLSYQEVASIMSLNINSTYVLISKAIDVLKHNVDKVCMLLLLADFLGR